MIIFLMFVSIFGLQLYCPLFGSIFYLIIKSTNESILKGLAGILAVCFFGLAIWIEFCKSTKSPLIMKIMIKLLLGSVTGLFILAALTMMFYDQGPEGMVKTVFGRFMVGCFMSAVSVFFTLRPNLKYFHLWPYSSKI